MSFSVKQVSERGSLATFLAIGIMLTALAVGGVYTVSRNRMHQVAPSITSQPSGGSSSPQSKSSQVPMAKQHQGSTPSTNNQQGASSRTTPLPATGTSDGIMGIAALGALVGVSTAYIRSVRERRLVW